MVYVLGCHDRRKHLTHPGLRPSEDDADKESILLNGIGSLGPGSANRMDAPEQGRQGIGSNRWPFNFQNSGWQFEYD